MQMKNTGLLSTSINGESYRNDQREEKAIKDQRKEKDRDRKWETASTRISGLRDDQGYEGRRASAEPDAWDALLQSQFCDS